MDDIIAEIGAVLISIVAVIGAVLISIAFACLDFYLAYIILTTIGLL